MSPEVPTLVGRRCTLRALRPGDAPALQRHADDPAVAFNLFDAWPQPHTLEAAQAWCIDGHRALAMVTAWAALPGITRLWMPIYARNPGSQAVARKAGYTLEGRMPLAVRKDGRAIDAVGYGCIRPGLSPGEAALPTLAP